MGSKLCCQNNKENFVYEQKIIEFLRKHPKVSHIIDQKRESSNSIYKERSYSTILKEIKSQNIQEFVTSEGIFIGDGRIDIQEKNGKGILLFHDGSYYQGQWKNNLKNGKGFYVDNTGETYDGDWEKDEPQGFGIFKAISPPYTYRGQWLQGMKNGSGVQEYEDGSSYSGQFKNGNKWGYGKLQYGDGTYYEGDFVDNVLEGNGTFYGKNHKYEGTWKNGKMHGTGKSQWYHDKGEISSKYVGEYVNGLKHGFGQYYDSKGTTYKGNWVQGEMNDKGIIFKSSYKSKKSLP